MGLVSLVADVVLLVGKLAGGVFAGSSALLADAVHTASDLISDVATLWFVRIGEQPPDAKHPYGHGRFETVGMVLLAGLLLVTAAGIAVEAVGVMTAKLWNVRFFASGKINCLTTVLDELNDIQSRP